MNNLSVKTKLIVLCAVALLGMVVCTGWLLYNLRDAMWEARKDDIRRVVGVGYSVLEHFHALEKSGKLSQTQAQTEARETLRKLRADEPGYYFITTLDMKRVLHPLNPHEEGTDRSQVKEKDGTISAKKYVDAVTSAPDKFGIVSVFANKPNLKDGVRYPKINGVRLFEPWNWMIASGMYVDDLEESFNNKLWQAGLVCLLLSGIIFVIAWAFTGSLLRALGGEPNDVAHVMQAIADGDLTQKIRCESKHESSLLASAARMQERLQSLIGEIRRTAGHVAQSAHALQDTSQQLQHTADDNAHAASSMVQAIDRLAGDINSISNLAASSHDHSATAAQHTMQGEQAVQVAAQEMERIVGSVDQASDIITGLSQRSQEITSVANVIKEIADQTNLLALNAAIEAARAGEQGRGFAIVADEVRKLAERTSTATQEIAERINAIQAGTSVVVEAMQRIKPQVADGVTQTRNVTTRLSEIRQSTEETLSKVNQVASSTNSQTEISREIAQHARTISDASHQSAQMMQSATQSVSELTSHAAELDRMVMVFKVD